MYNFMLCELNIYIYNNYYIYYNSNNIIIYSLHINSAYIHINEVFKASCMLLLDPTLKINYIIQLQSENSIF